MLQSRRNGHSNEKQEQTRWKLSWRRRKKSAGRLKNPPLRCINPSKLPITIGERCRRPGQSWPHLLFARVNSDSGRLSASRRRMKWSCGLTFHRPASRPKRLRNSITSTILTHDSIYRSMDRDWSRWPHRAWKWPGNVWANFV